MELPWTQHRFDNPSKLPLALPSHNCRWRKPTSGMDRSLERSKSHASSIDNNDGSIDSELSCISEKDACCFCSLLDCCLDDEYNARRTGLAYPFGTLLPGNRTTLAPRTTHSFIVNGTALSTLRAIISFLPIPKTKDDLTNKRFHYSSFRIRSEGTVAIPWIPTTIGRDWEPPIVEYPFRSPTYTSNNNCTCTTDPSLRPDDWITKQDMRRMPLLCSITPWWKRRTNRLIVSCWSHISTVAKS